MLPTLLVFCFACNSQVTLVVPKKEPYLTQENTCSDFTIYFQGKDVTDDPRFAVESREAIHQVMTWFFPDDCARRPAGPRFEAPDKVYRVDGKFYLSADGRRVEKFQVTVKKKLGNQVQISLISQVAERPPVPSHVSLRRTLIEAHLEFLQKFTQAQTCL